MEQGTTFIKMKCKFCEMEIYEHELCKVQCYPDGYNYAHKGCWKLWSIYQTKLEHINHICGMVLDGTTNWDNEQIEEFIKQIDSIAKSALQTPSEV